MKKVACLITSTLILFLVSSGIATGQSRSALAGPLEEVVDEASNPVETVEQPVEEVTKAVNGPVEKLQDPIDKVKDQVDKVVKQPVEEVTKVVEQPVEEVTKVVDKVAKDVTETAKNPSGAVGSVGDKPKPAPAPGSAAPPAQSKPSITANGSSATNDKVASASVKSGKASNRSGIAPKGADRDKPAGDTEEVATAGHTIEPAQVKGAQIIAPATEAEESEGSGLSRTGVQILTWLILACWLLGAGAAFVKWGRTRVRFASS